MDSKDLLGCDFTHLAAYIDMTYGNDSDLWFKLDAAEDGETVLAERSCTVPGTFTEVKRKAEWARISSELGVHQGRPLSCFFAAVGLVRCLNAAQAAIDTFNGVDRKRFEAEASDEEKAAAWELSERYGAVSSYLDDASFLAAAQALCVAYDAYTEVARARGWRCVEKKSRVAMGHYHTEGQPAGEEADGFGCGDRVGAGVTRFPGVHATSPATPDEEAPGTNGDRGRGRG